ncbi:MAG: DUF378 domain-containing protein [Rhodobacteraceae bacterium PARR1]|nr:MAG: DUF378 domain-containing protein [Rhodobacteraceae bacterium PARR1]
MHMLNIVTLLLIIIGGINWLLVGLFQYDLVAELFGGQSSGLARMIYILVGLSALWQLVPFARMVSGDVVRDTTNRDSRR